MAAWSYEFHTVEVTPDQWRQQLEAAGADLLFVESAWHGNHGSWDFQLTGSAAPSSALRELVDHCRAAGIPTVFWNKEDPPHFHDFIETARIFDYVFTTDETLVPAYRHELGHERIYTLPFAAQPAIHNPIRPRNGHQSRDVAFAGMYFAHKFPERRAQMDVLLGGALDASRTTGSGFDIFSRFLGEDPRYQFPEELASHVVGSLDYSRMLTAYKAYKLFLNVNSVIASPSMCARRVFEISASGTPVLSTPSPALERFFPPDEVPVARSREDAAESVRSLIRSQELRDRTVHRAQRRIWREHTYNHRAREVLTAIGLSEFAARPALKVSALVVTNRPHQLEHVLRQLGCQRDVDIELILITHGYTPVGDPHDLVLGHGLRNFTHVRAPGEWTLGRCLNEAVSRSRGDILAKIDDDDLYGPWYLHDQICALDYSGADIVGKQAHYMYLDNTGATLLRFPWREHRFTDRVMGPTITGWRRVFEDNPFPDISRGEDSAFLQSVLDGGGVIYSADRFQFTQVRRTAHDHSWGVDEAAMLATADVAWFGRNDEHVNA